MPYQRLHGRIDRLRDERRLRPHSAVDWALLTDAELERLEPIALRAMSCPDVPTFMATLAPADRAWLTVIAARLDQEER